MGDVGEEGGLEAAKSYARRAVEFERVGQLPVASYYYTEAARLLREIVDQTSGDNTDALKSLCEQYEARAVALARLVAEAAAQASSAAAPLARDPAAAELARAKHLLEEALRLDENDQKSDALGIYTEAVEVCLKARQATADSGLKERLSKIAAQALDRAETIKQPSAHQLKEKEPEVRAKNIVRPLGNLSLTDNSSEETGRSSRKGGGDYTEEERRVLAATTTINNREYLPFIAADLRERFAFPLPFSDAHGKLALSAKQRQKLTSWARPDEFIQNPAMIHLVDCYSVKQTVVSDCSFVASIAIAAQYEKKFKKRLITSIIYPQNKAGDPVYNPCGKYMIRLFINGVARKVVVDDYLPLGPYNQLLCSYSSNKSELWISMLEKAYMKVMGGYDFPGSNSNIDLYALTGWIPERVALRAEDPSFNADEVFKRLHDRFHQGHVLATAATGELSDAAADHAGLVTTHAYAVLDVREFKGERLFLLKNPWSHLRWRGNWSELDIRHWTPEFQEHLNYNPEDAANFDNGVFWIDYKSLQKYFDVLYLNWDPALFKHSFCLHQLWKAGSGPVKDIINIGENPQFSLEIRNCGGGGAVWLLLSRHITDIEDFRNNKEYITLLVYKNHGRRVYYPFDPPPYLDGIRINSPHYLTKMVLPPGDSVRKFTVVVSQFEKSATIYFTVRAYSNQPFTMEKVADPYRNKKEVTGKWQGRSAGGCANNKETWSNNPKYKLVVDSHSHIQIQLKGPKQYPLGFDLICVSATDKESTNYFAKKSTGIYRPGFVVSCLEMVAGTYDLVPSTYYQGQEGPFFLSVASSASFDLSKSQ